MSYDPPAGDERPLLLLVASSYWVYRRYILESVSARYRLWLLNPTPSSWEDPYIIGSTVVDCLDLDKLTDAARAVARDHDVAGVFCYDEVYIETSAHLSAALGFPVLDPGAVARCRDKSATRRALADAGFPQPASRAVSSLADARAFAAEIGYPLIVKPRNLGGSLGLSKVEGPDGLDAAFALTDGTRMDGIRQFDDYVIVEEFLDGPEISVECVLSAGECTPLIVARKVLGGSGRLAFEEIGHDVDANDPLLFDADFHEMLTGVHAAAGFTDGCTHIEFKLTPDGAKHVIEINVRLGGGMIPYLGLLTSGVDAPLAAADVAAGRRPAVAFPKERRAASIRFAYPPYDMEITSATAHRDLMRPPVAEVEVGTQPGARVRLPPHGLARTGYVIAVGATLDETRAAVPDAGRYFTFEGAPLEPAP
ncbi:ATP-grasp domain-containing protein [Actinomadura verrucosospora]|uniref:Carbamoyl-phosphate synthase L chain ATP-binding protein n=1 Tax=Actinomadura verrucosospora TaxID=46165 RepID=A0A7D3VUT0_ACTVE|nr:ATP-grasp domain-containing protein [Actinomadura verrucosospora]QKG23680.1 carbamoyl-phosphate synthase L chain ATP-binding protein [Actinomadura verrucosospora]